MVLWPSKLHLPAHHTLTIPHKTPIRATLCSHPWHQPVTINHLLIWNNNLIKFS